MGVINKDGTPWRQFRREKPISATQEFYPDDNISLTESPDSYGGDNFSRFYETAIAAGTNTFTPIRKFEIGEFNLSITGNIGANTAYLYIGSTLIKSWTGAAPHDTSITDTFIGKTITAPISFVHTFGSVGGGSYIEITGFYLDE